MNSLSSSSIILFLSFLIQPPPPPPSIQPSTIVVMDEEGRDITNQVVVSAETQEGTNSQAEAIDSREMRIPVDLNDIIEFDDTGATDKSSFRPNSPA